MDQPKPYYQDEFTTIYCGDSRIILPTLAGINTIITDPPYGISVVAHNKVFGTSNAAKCNIYKPVIGDDRPFNPAHLLPFDKVVIFGGNYFSEHLPSSPCWLIWDKRDGINSNPMADCELAWTNINAPARLYHHRWMGMIRASNDPRLHPTQKPISVMQWVIEQIKPDGVICDPYMGSGSTLIAARNLSHKAIGIEIDEEYCEVAVQRLLATPLSLCALNKQPSSDGSGSAPEQLSIGELFAGHFDGPISPGDNF